MSLLADYLILCLPGGMGVCLLQECGLGWVCAWVGCVLGWFNSGLLVGVSGGRRKGVGNISFGLSNYFFGIFWGLVRDFHLSSAAAPVFSVAVFGRVP